jgi:hypothetical protein
MATPLDLEKAGKLFKLDPALEANEQEWRTIYVLPRAKPRFQTNLSSQLGGSRLIPASNLTPSSKCFAQVKL